MSTSVTLERYAEIRAEMEAGRLRDEVLARAGLTSDEWTVAQRAWLEKMGTELERGRFELTNRYTQAFLERQRTFTAALPPAAVAKAPLVEEAPPPPAPSAAAAPPPVMPLIEALPPQVQPPSAAAAPPPVMPLIEALPPQVQPPAAPIGANVLTETTTFIAPLVADHREVLPFRKEPLGNASSTDTIDVALDAEEHDHEALPFKKDLWANTSPTSTLDITLDDEEHEREVLPFKKGNPTDTIDIALNDEEKKAQGAPLPFAPVAPQATPSDEVMKLVQGISLAQYADICATIRAFPDQIVQIRSYYRMDLPTWTALHKVWHERFEEDPTLRFRWEAQVQAAMAKRAR